ncbi:MAG: recombinase family protein [Candidatus Limnocylindrus sp.]
MGPQMRVGYIRVSTDTGEQLAALTNQRARIEAAGVDHLIEDVESGLSQDRPGYLELLRLIDARQISEIICTRIDRLGRDASATDALIAICARRQVVITALDGGTVDSSTPQGFLLSRIATSMAEVESRMLSMRIKAGYAEGRKRGRPLRGRAPWGYLKNADNSALIPDPQEWSRAQEFITLLRRLSWRMNTALDEWHRAGKGEIPLNSCRSVKGWLLNPVIRGGLGYKQRINHQFDEILWDTHPPLISHQEFAVLTRQLEDNRRRWGHAAKLKPRLLTGLCRCGGCGKMMTYAGSRAIASVLCKSRECEQRYKSTREDVVRAAINRALSARAADVSKLAASPEPPEALELRLQIEKLEAANDPDLHQAIEIKRQRLQQLQARGCPDPELLAAFSDPRVWDQVDDLEELRVLYLQFVQSVLIDHQQVQDVVLRL